jgi:hypothetical protein
MNPPALSPCCALYNYWRKGPTFHLLGPTLAAASEFLPLNQKGLIDGFRARDNIIRAGREGVLCAADGSRNEVNAYPCFRAMKIPWAILPAWTSCCMNTISPPIACIRAISNPMIRSAS